MKSSQGGGGPGGGSGGKKNLEKTRKDSELKALLTLMLKTQLRTEQKLRELEAVSFDTWVGAAETPFLTLLTEQTQNYSCQTKGKKDHKLGPPHVYAFLGCLDGLLKHHKEQVGAKNCQVVEAWGKELEELPWEEVAEKVKLFKLSKVYDKDKRRLTACFSPELGEQRRAFVSCLDQLGWERKHGKAPPSHMERELQAFLEALVK